LAARRPEPDDTGSTEEVQRHGYGRLPVPWWVTIAYLGFLAWTVFNVHYPALFIGGFAVGVYGFLDNQNGKYAEFGEASARNVHLGAAGLGTAFAGGSSWRTRRIVSKPSIPDM